MLSGFCMASVQDKLIQNEIDKFAEDPKHFEILIHTWLVNSISYFSHSYSNSVIEMCI